MSESLWRRLAAGVCAVIALLAAAWLIWLQRDDSADPGAGGGARSTVSAEAAALARPHPIYEPNRIIGATTEKLPVQASEPEPAKARKRGRPAPPPPAAAPAAAKTGKPREIHKELIPKNITIVDSYYSEDVVAPGSPLGLDIDGSGFDAQFGKTLSMDTGSPDVKVKSMRVVTANQIHVAMEVGPEAKTAYVQPYVLIRGEAVFKAPHPFGVVRPGEVLDVKLTGVSPDGHTQPFQVVANLDAEAARQLRVDPTLRGMVVRHLRPASPLAVDGVLDMDDPYAGGDVGVVVRLGERELFRKEKLLRLVLPDLGKKGWIYTVDCQERFRRPGDRVEVTLRGTGIAEEDVYGIRAQVAGLRIRKDAFSFRSDSEVGLRFVLPADAAPGPYGLTIQGPRDKVVKSVSDLFTVVPAQWVARLEVSPTAVPGGKSTLRVVGRDLTRDFARTLQVLSDEPGLKVSAFKFLDASTLAAQLTLEGTVAPGDYWLHLSAGGKPVQPQFGSVIKVAAK